MLLPISVSLFFSDSGSSLVEYVVLYGCSSRECCAVLCFLFLAKVDHVSSLERCAHITLCLVQDLQTSTDKVTTLTASKVVMTETDKNDSVLPSLRTALLDGTERAQFLMKLAPRIRRLESDTITALTHRMEQTLRNLQQLREGTVDEKNGDHQIPPEDELLLMLGHCMRGLALLGRGKEVENIFARIAIMYVQ